MLRAHSISDKRRWINHLETQCHYVATMEKRLKEEDNESDDKARKRLTFTRTGHLKPIGTLQVLILEGRGLVQVEKQGATAIYCSVRLNRQQLKTRTSGTQINPRWAQPLMFSVVSLDEVLKISIFNYDKYSQDDYLGSAEVQLDFLEYYGGRETEKMTLKLRDVPRGEVVLQMAYRTK
ncbi:hypothetical protein HK102_002430 [Quaeritorhiza haematococci]|nr:hypothetical protein HK102_002430 [Quaeritorhiza haematococci]